MRTIGMLIEFIDNFQKILNLVKKECCYFDSIFDLPKTFEDMKFKKSIL